MARRATGEGSIGKRKDGTYYGTIMLDSRRQWVYGRTRKEVVQKLAAISEKGKQGLNTDAAKITVAEFLERYLALVKTRNKYRTYQSYKEVTHNHLIPHLGKIRLASLKPDHVQHMLDTIKSLKTVKQEDEQEVPKDLAARTLRNVRAVLRQALNQAIRWRYISYNAAALAELPRIEQFEIKPWTLAQAQTFLTSLNGHPRRALYTLALMLGLREGEVLGLRIASLNFEEGTITIDATLQFQEGKLVRESVKTSASNRTLHLPRSLLPLLKEHVEQQQALFPDNPYLFCSRKGNPISPYHLYEQFTRLVAKAGLPRIRFHDLRHSCATLLIATNTHPRTIMEILGHSQISTTMNIYGHVLTETQKQAIIGLDSLLSGG